MNPSYDTRGIQIFNGDVLDVLRGLPDELVQTVVTSPPYCGLRDYGVAGQIGLEPTPEEYVAKMVEVFREVRRVLRDDGTAWINLGDSYAGGSRDSNPNGKQGTNRGTANFIPGHFRGFVPTGLKAKDLCGIPWRVAFALQADGWYLRSDIIWAKPNPMPESVTDRPTKAHEYIFLLTKSERYFYDAEAIREPKAESTVSDQRTNDNGHRRYRAYPGSASNGGTNLGGAQGGRNKRTVWNIATQPFSDWQETVHLVDVPTGLHSERNLSLVPPECSCRYVKEVKKSISHFATFPTEIPRLCILAGSKPGDVVMDLFHGSGTTGMMAQDLNRRYIGIELNEDYIKMSLKRFRQHVLPLSA